MAKSKTRKSGGQKAADGNSNYEVGRNKPSEHTRFKPVEKRHRPGRPPGSKNLSTLIMEAARDQVIATIGGKQRKISKVQATTMQLATNAAAGDPKAMIKFLDWVDEIETRAAAARPTCPTPIWKLSTQFMTVFGSTKRIRLANGTHACQQKGCGNFAQRPLRIHSPVVS